METWDKSVISSGSYMPYRIGDLSEAEKKANKIYFSKRVHTQLLRTELSVSGNIFLRVNGKPTLLWPWICERNYFQVTSPCFYMGTLSQYWL